MSATPDADLAARLDRVESILAIQQLVADYGNGFDHRDVDRLSRLFHEDANYDLGELGAHVGRDAIIEAAHGLWAANPEQHHWHSNLSIDLDGDRAAGLVALNCVVTNEDDGPVMLGGYYEDRYERRDGVWRFAERRFVMEYWTPIRGPLREGVTNDLGGVASS